MNPVAEKLGVLGLPAPVSELAARDWDVVVVGGGHNGLTAAAYLAKAGKSVLVLERAERVGGACTLERPFADQDFVVSPCAYVVGLLDEVVISELGLRGRGYKVTVGDPEMFVPLGDGNAFVEYVDDERTAAGLREIGVCDADVAGFFDYRETFDRARRKLREGARDSWVGDSPSRAEIEEMLGEEELVHLVFEASIAEMLESKMSDTRLHDAMSPQGLICAYGGPRTPGTALIHLMHHLGQLEDHGSSWGYVAGGIGMVSFAIADAAIEAGAQIACGTEVGAIVPGEGVELAGGTLIRARDVICNADPKVAMRLLEGQGVPEDFAERLGAWKVRSPTMKLNAALSDLPRWTAAGDETWPANGTINVTAGMDACQDAFEACERGESQLGFVEIYCQTAADPSPAPEGKHLISAFCQYAPYERADGPWDDAKRERAAAEVIRAVEEHAPGFADLIEHHELLAPPDIERKIGLTGGHIFQGECFPDQMWDRRLASRTPVPNLYLCGAATHPGGSVIALNGRNAASALLADRGEPAL
ncbi:NAD(P)/FAD-dependent oxidoreductase [soil metagenome]